MKSLLFEVIINYGWNRTTNVDPMLRKLNKNGEQIWVKNFGTVPEVEEHPYGLKLMQNGFLYALYHQANNGTVLTKIDLNGNTIWNYIIGLNDNYIYEQTTKLKINSSGVCYVNIQRYNRNLILKINPSGILIDSIVVNNVTDFNVINNFEVSSTNKIYLIKASNPVYPYESSVYCIDSLHNLLWEKRLGVYGLYPQIIIKNDNEIYTAFYTFPDTNKIQIIKISNGNEIWNRKESKGGGIYWNGWTLYPKFMLDSDGNLIFAGNQFISGIKNSFFICKVNRSTGQTIWKQNLNQFSVETTLGGLAIDSTGNYYACGRIQFANYNTGNSYGIIKMSHDGAILRTTLNNGLHYAAYFPFHIGITKTNDVVVSGVAADTGSYDFYAQSLTIKYSQPVNITPNGNSLPDKFSLSQNYPNPFNPTTRIIFQIPKSTFVSLKVFDINGREISELVNENLNAGEYKVNFDGSALPSGVYYYKLTSGNFSETKKMILIK